MHEHLSRELFRAIHKGWRNPGDLAAIAMAHLFELCPHCQHEFETWRSELGEGVARDEGDYDGVVQRIRERTAANDLGPEGERARLEGERRDARSRAEEVLALPDDQRLDWIRKERTHHSGVLLVEALIEECRRKTPGHPREGYVLADLARVTLHHAPVTAYAVELYGLALARFANAIRVIGDLPRADQVLGDARFIVRSQAGADRLIRAEIDSLEAVESANLELESLERIPCEDPLLKLRDQWLSSDIALSAGDYRTAEEELRSVRSDFEDRGLQYDVASADLDLARIFVAAGNRNQSLIVLERAEAVFAGLGVTAGLAKIRELRSRAQA